MRRVGLILGAMLLSAPAAARPTAALFPRREPPPPATPPPIDQLDVPAESEATPWTERPLAIEGHGSFGGPFGLFGVAADMSFSNGFSTSLGVGYAHAAGAPQIGSQLRLRLLLTETMAIGAEGGMAIGAYEDVFECPSGVSCPPDWRWERALWGYAGLMLEARSDSGWTLRWSFGSGAILNVVDGICRRCDASDEPSIWVTTVPYIDLAVGRSFEL